MRPSVIVNADKIVQEVLQEMTKHSGMEKMEVIRMLARKFEFSDDHKIDIISDLTDIVAIDDVVDTEEHKALAYIRSVT